MIHHQSSLAPNANQPSVVQQKFYQPPDTHHSSMVHHQSYQAPVMHQPSQASFLPIDSGLAVPSFLPSDDPIASNDVRSSATGSSVNRNGVPSTVASSASAVLMAKHSDYDLDVLSEVLTHDTYLDNKVIDKRCIVQDTSSSAQQDALMSVIEEMSNQVAKCNEVDKVNKTVHESLTADLERYKEQIKIFKHDELSVIDTEEMLELAEECRLKMHTKQNDPIAKDKKVNIAPIDYA
ncbi:hypothetical protein Tco_0787410, partial [Tanacetum coccineum]